MTARQTGRSGRQARKGFTLVELLVVIAIVAVLIALLTPIITEAKKIAILAACSVHMNGLYKGLTTYAGEFDNYLPPDGYDVLDSSMNSAPNLVAYHYGHTGKGLLWGGLLDYYDMCESKIFTCPGTECLDPAWDPEELQFLRNHITRMPASKFIRESIIPQDYLWCNYALRDGNRPWDEAYGNTTLMMLEASNFYEKYNLPYWSIRQHGGAIPRGVEHGDPVPELDMNAVFSDGTVRRIRDYANVDKWDWESQHYNAYPSTQSRAWGIWWVIDEAYGIEYEHSPQVDLRE